MPITVQYSPDQTAMLQMAYQSGLNKFHQDQQQLAIQNQNQAAELSLRQQAQFQQAAESQARLQMGAWEAQTGREFRAQQAEMERQAKADNYAALRESRTHEKEMQILAGNQRREAMNQQSELDRQARGDIAKENNKARMQQEAFQIDAKNTDSQVNQILDFSNQNELNEKGQQLWDSLEKEYQSILNDPVVGGAGDPQARVDALRKWVAKVKGSGLHRLVVPPPADPPTFNHQMADGTTIKVPYDIKFRSGHKIFERSEKTIGHHEALAKEQRENQFKAEQKRREIAAEYAKDLDKYNPDLSPDEREYRIKRHLATVYGEPAPPTPGTAAATAFGDTLGKLISEIVGGGQGNGTQQPAGGDANPQGEPPAQQPPAQEQPAQEVPPGQQPPATSVDNDMNDMLAKIEDPRRTSQSGRDFLEAKRREHAAEGRGRFYPSDLPGDPRTSNSAPPAKPQAPPDRNDVPWSMQDLPEVKFGEKPPAGVKHFRVFDPNKGWRSFTTDGSKPDQKELRVKNIPAAALPKGVEPAEGVTIMNNGRKYRIKQVLAWGIIHKKSDDGATALELENFNAVLVPVN